MPNKMITFVLANLLWLQYYYEQEDPFIKSGHLFMVRGQQEVLGSFKMDKLSSVQGRDYLQRSEQLYGKQQNMAKHPEMSSCWKLLLPVKSEDKETL